MKVGWKRDILTKELLNDDSVSHKYKSAVRWALCVIDQLINDNVKLQEANKMDVSKEMNTVREAIQTDPMYAWAWHCQIALSIQDTLHVNHEDANRTAAATMVALFGVDVTKCVYWKNFPWS